MPAACCSTASTSPALPRTCGASASCSRTTRSSPTATSRATSPSGCACAEIRRERIAARTAELLELVGLTGFERRSVGSLSGGEQQRVALARALAPEPRVLLLDEPLGSLDRRLRDRLLDDLGRLFDELGVTAMYVTHDQTEAFTLGDRVAVMRAGRVVQVATPDELWSHPVDADVARFLGLANVDGGRGRSAGGGDGSRGDRRRAAPSRAPCGRARSCACASRSTTGAMLEAAVAAVDHPAPGDRVDVTVDPEGIVRLR